MLKTTIGRLRAIGLLEGISFLLLLGVAMPLKYAYGMPEAVRFAGSVHGLFFVVFCLALFHAFIECEWSVKRAAGIFCAAVMPFGPFIVDGGLKREQEAREAAPAVEATG